VLAPLGSAAFLKLRKTLAREHRSGCDLRDAARANHEVACVVTASEPFIALALPPRFRFRETVGRAWCHGRGGRLDLWV